MKESKPYIFPGLDFIWFLNFSHILNVYTAPWFYFYRAYDKGETFSRIF